MNQVGGLMFGAQVGQGLSGLAREVVASTDVGLPLGPTGVAALVPANVAAFGEGLERPDDEVRLYLALREAAHQRLFAHVPWLRQRMLDTVAAYARGITVDLSAIERAMGEIDPSNPAERAGRAVRRPVRAADHARAAGGAAPARDPARAGRGLGRRGRRRRGRRADARCRRAARGLAPPPRDRRPGRADLRHAGRAGAAPAPAARGGRAVVGASPRSTASPDATTSGRTPTCCRPPTTSTTRSASPTRSAPARLTADDAKSPATSRSDDRADERGRRGDRGRPGPGARTTLRRSRRPARRASPARSSAVVGEAELRGRADAVEVAAGPLGARVALHQRPEVRPVPGTSRCASSCTRT